MVLSFLDMIKAKVAWDKIKWAKKNLLKDTTIGDRGQNSVS